MVKMEALGTFVSCSLVIFFSPSKSKKLSKVGGAFMVKRGTGKNHFMKVKARDEKDAKGLATENGFTLATTFSYFPRTRATRSRR